ncbi:TPA: ead/Ea22-like family protein [Escherichia coli]
MSKINYQALREIAKQATQSEWVAFISPGTGTYAVHTPGDKRCEDVIKWTGFDGQKNAENNARYIAAFNPEVVQALLDERERNQQYIKRRDQENEDIALTVGRLLIENGQLVADTLRHLADNEIDSDYFAITSTNENGTEIDHEMAITDYALQAAGTVDELVAALESAEKRIAELEAEPVSQAYNLAELIEGMEVSIDVSTCDADLGNRYFGTVTEALELDTAKNGYILLVQDAEPNFDVNGNSPVTPDGLSTVCAEAYQVVGVMADALGVFGDAAVQKVLDNLSQQKLVHRDVLPFSLPVTPDGWISCSERMPDKLIPVMVMYEDGEMWSAMWNGNRWDDGTEYPDPHSVTHWREMPAAPQQEVK